MKLSEYLKKNNMTSKEYFEMQGRRSKGKTTLTDYRRNQKNELTQKVGLDTLETDLTSLGKTVNDIWDGWQTEETMRNTRSSIESMYDRLLSYQDFQKQYGGADLSELTKTYKTVLDDWDNRTTLYGGFKNADAYNVAVKNTKLSEQFKGLSYDEVQAEIKKYKPDSDEYKFLSNYTDYTDLNDFDKALKNTNPTIPVERPEWYSYVKENYDNWTIPKVGQLNEEKTKKTGVISYYTGSDVAAAESEREKYFKEFSGGQTLAEFEKSFKESQINSTYKTLETKKNLRQLETGVYDSYKHLESNADFEEKSKAVASDNLAYKYINGDKATRQQMVADHYTPNWTQYATSNEIPYTQPSQYEKGSYDELTEKEIKLYNYLFNESEESAAKFLEGMRTTLNKRATQRATDSIKAEIDGSVGASIVYSLLSIPMNIAGGIASAGDYLTGNTNPYSTNKLASNVATSIRQEVGANIAESTDGFELFGQNIPSFLYQTGMSMGDTLLGGATFGAGYSVIAGSTAFQQKHRELIEAGESQDIALSGALASGMAEVVFEYISIDKLLKIKSIDSLKKALGTALKQGGVEASEEFLTELSNIISDDAIRGESSELNKLRKDLKARGYNEKEINIAIAKQIGGQLGWAAAGGFLSGGVMGGGASAMAYGKMSSIGKGIQERDRTSEMLETASLTPEETEAYKAYSEYTKKGINADNIKNAQLGNLYYLSKSESEGTLNSKKSSISDKQKAVETIQRLSVVESENTDAKRKKELNVGESTTITSTGNSANIEGIKLSGDKTTIVTNEGDVSVNDMTLSDHDADLVVKAEGIAKEYGEEMGNLFLTQYDGKTEVDRYATSFNLTMEYAKHNFTQDMMLENKGVLSTSQVQAIYNATVHQQYVEQDNKIKTITEKQGKSQFIQGTFDDSIIDYDGNTTDGSKVNYKNLTPQQRAALNFAKLFSKATGVNIKLTKSDIELGKHKGKNGSYNPETNTIEIDVYAGRIDAKSVEDSIIPTLSHEVTHWMKYKANTIYESIREDVMKTLAKGNAHNLTETELVALEMERIKKNHPDMTVTPEYAIDELVARACEDMLTNSNKARKLLSKMSKTEQNDFIAKVKETFENLMQWVNDLLSVYKSGSAEAQILRNYKDMLKKISKQWDAMLETAIESNQALQNEGIIAEQLVNGISEDGTTIVGRNNLQMSERTYAEGGRDFLINWLSEQEGLTQADKEDILSQTDRIAELMKDIRENNELPDYARWAATDVVKDEDGNKVLSVIVKNGDYAMNIDFSQVCKKRVALNAVLNAMVQSGDLNTYVLTETDVADLNAIIKEHEFEIACALCFVDSKRYRVGGWAESFCEGADKKKNGKMVHQYGFNEMVRSLVPKGSKIQIDEFNFTNRDIVGQPTSNLLSEMDDSELDFTLIDEILKNEYKEGSKPTDLYAYAKAIKDNKELRKILNPAEIISSIGLDAIRLENKDLYKLINRHQGTAKPKFAHDSVAYTNDVLMASNFTKEKAKYVGGVRCQSFSDFMANMVFDYVQFVSELSSKELTSHSYTKEPLFVRLFGMTGMKINMSLVPKAVQMTPEQEKYFAILNDPNANKRSAEYKNAKRDYDKLTENAGLDENGNYIWEDETFPYDIAMELVDDPRYSANCGTIAVGISDNHIYKLLQDDKISMVIPYHKSGLNHIVAKMRNIDLYKDYTNTQNTRFANGKKLENTPDFDFYGDLYGRDGKEGTHNPKQTTENYLKWCDEHNYIPKFETSVQSRKFRDNPNYYKLLVDFRVYDTDGTYKEQQPVKPIYPANEEFKDLILNGVKDKNGKVYGGLKQQQGTSDKLSAESKQIVEEFRNTLKNKYGKDVMAVKNADRDGSTYAPTFYSHMGKTINEIKQDKIGANSVVSYLKGKGVKNEEIKWSGIESFLEGKKSVTKQELQEFVAGSMLQIEETALEDVGDQNNTRWGKYKLDGGANYREILFKIPNSSYSNEMMRGHWGDDAQGILAHARIQDFDVDGKKMLFIEEIQSDWHNLGHKSGYMSKADIENIDRNEKDTKEQISQDPRMARFVKRLGADNVFDLMKRRVKLNQNGERVYNYLFNKAGFNFQRKAEKAAVAEHYAKVQALTPADSQAHEAPFKDNYHEFVLKNLLRNAAENGYDSIGWTPAEVQSKRWSDEYAEGYRIEYDQDMPKFLKKYGKQWGASVGATTLPNGTEVWSMDITDSMRDSVLYEGQVMYSDRDSAGNTLTQEQIDYFKDSKVRDKDGNLLVVRHGTSEDFHIFDFSKAGKNGKAEGAGFYFSDEMEITKRYGDIQKEVYLNITKPMYNTKRTVKKAELTKFVNDLIDFDTQKWDSNWKDSFISNYVNTYEFQMSKRYAVQQFVNQIWEYNTNDQDLIFEIAQADGRTYANDTMKEFYDVLTESIGYDGIIAEWSHSEGKSNVYVTFNSEQSKYTSNKKPTSNLDMRYADRVKPNVDKYGYNADNISRANKKGELVNDYYYALSKREWTRFYAEITNNGYLATANVGTFAPIVINNKLVIAERQYKGKDAHDYIVIDVLQLNGALDWDILNMNGDALGEGDLIYDRQAVYQNISRFLERNQSAGVLTRFDADSQQYVVGSAYRNNGKSNKGFHRDSQERSAREGLSLRDKPSIQGTDGLLKQNSDRIEESVYDRMGETEALSKDNKQFEEDVDRLKEKLKISKDFDRSKLNTVAEVILNKAGSNFDKKDLVSLIDNVYTYIATSDDLNWQDLLSQCYDVARMVLDGSSSQTAVSDYYKMMMKGIRDATISPTEQQTQNAKSVFGNDYHAAFFGKVKLDKSGASTSLKEQWAKWNEAYPDVFDANVSESDLLVELNYVYDNLKSASSIVEQYGAEEQIRWLAKEIYNQYWNVSPAQAKSEQVKQLNFEHKRAMKDIRDRYESRLVDTKKKALERYKKIRDRKDNEIAEVKQKSKEMMSAYKENAEKKTKIQSITSNALTLNKWLKDNSKDHHINETLKPVVVNLLQAIDFSSKQMLNKNIPTQKDISLYKALQDVKNMFANANNETALSDLTEMYGIDMDEDITKMLDSAFDTLTSLGDNGYILNKMNLDELNTLNKVVKTIKQVVTKLNKFHIANHFKGVTNLSQNSIVYFDKLGQAKVYDPSKLKGRVAKLLNWSNATPYYAFKRFGDGGKVMFEALQDGQDKLAFNIKSIIDYSNKAYTNKEVRDWSQEVKSIKVRDMITNKDVTVQITVAQAMSLYCSLKREQAQGHILGDGIRITDITTKKGKVISQAEGVKLSADDLSALTGILTDRQIQVADKLQEFMNTICTEWGNEISMARFGYKAFGEPNYFPISSDKNNLAVDDAKEESNSLFRLLNMSFTKSVKEGASNKVEIKNIFDVFAQHSSDMAKYNAFALPILDFYKWYNYTEKGMVNGENRTVASLKASMEKAFGKDAKEYVTTFLKDINGQYDVSRDTLGKGLFKNAKIAAVGMNLRVVLLQPTSYFRASAVIDNKYLAKALLHKPKVSKATEHCGMALWKSLGYYDTNIQRGVTDQIKHNETWKDKAVEVSMKGAEVADKITWGYLWNACELEIRDTRKDLQVGSQEFYDAISKRLRDVIYATQVVDSTMTRSQMMRSQGMYDKMLTSFASEPTLAYNMVVDAFDSARLEKRADGKISGNSVKKIARVVAAYTITNAVAALVESGFDAFRDEDDEEMDLTEFMKLYFTNFAFDMSLTAKIPYVKEFVSIMQGFTSSRTDTQWMQSLGYALKGWYKVLAGDGKPVSALKNSLRSLSYLSGMPFYNAYRDTMALFDKLDVLTAEEIEEWLEDLFS